MADISELKQMVLTFRVSELHVLLGFAGRNKSGRKQELTQRALQLVQKNCSIPVQIKIKELYRQVYSGQQVNGPGSPAQTKDNIMPLMPHPQGMLGYPPEGAGIDYSTMRPMMPQAAIPVNPDVKLKHLPFYDVLAELMKPSSLIPKSPGRMQESLFVFHLTPQQAQDITLSRDYRPGAKVEYNVQVQLRFCLLETTSEQADTFPSQIQVRVNNKPATLPPKQLPLHNKAPPKPWGKALDVTCLCRLSPTVENRVQISWFSDVGRSFCLSIYLVSKLTSEILLQRLKQFGNRHSDHTKALIKEKLEQDPDSEIATTSLRVSLMCPLGKMRMQIPCRASTCTHLQCFDAMTFLKMNERKPTWLCPVCDRPCSYEKLTIDGYFAEILRKAPCSEINFHDDGTWSQVKNQKESSKQVILTAPKPAAAPSHVNTASAVTATTSLMNPLSHSNQSTPKPATAAAKGPVIDLTLDSSDEDDDAVIPNDPVCISPSPVINLDSPSPAPISAVPSSPTVLLSSSSSSPSPAHAHSTSQSSFSVSSSNFNGHISTSSSSVPTLRDSPPSLGSMDSILRQSPGLSQAPSSSSVLQAQAQALNLEAMSDADFDEFLKGLSWGV